MREAAITTIRSSIALGLVLAVMMSVTVTGVGAYTIDSSDPRSLHDARDDNDVIGVLIRQLQDQENELARDDSAVRGEPLVSLRAEHRLQVALQQYLSVEALGGWLPIDDGPTLAPGIRDARVGQIRDRLRLAGDWPDSARASPHAVNNFDEALATAVRAFQTRHGLVVDGRVGSRTRLAMNVPVQIRVAQLQQNLTRVRRWRPTVTSQRYVMVNIPAYELIAVNAATVELKTPVIVGRPDRPTPELSASITAVNFHPTWYVPGSIARRDLFPKLTTDPDFFVRGNYLILKSEDGTVLDPFDPLAQALTPEMIRLRQLPGPGNALGLIRLDMPNRYAVYLHDTGSPELFARRARDISSGCVRVRKIIDLTAWLLAEEPAWNSGAQGNAGNDAPDETLNDALNEALRRNISRSAQLTRPVPVHFVYLTAWVQPNGSVQFRHDVYGLDRANASDPAPSPQIPETAPSRWRPVGAIRFPASRG